MKKLLLALLFAVSSCAHAQAINNATIPTMIDPTGSYYLTRVMYEPPSNGLYFFDTSSHMPSFVTLGTGLSVGSGALNVAISSGSITSALGYTPTSQADARAAISLTTTGSGAATYNNVTGVLNVPTPAAGGSVSSVGITSSNLTVSGSPVTTSGNIAISLPNAGTAGTYNGYVTTDALGRVIAGADESINDNPGRSLVTTTSSTGFQISSSRPVRVCYEGSISTTSTIGGPASGSVFLETADTNSTTPSDWTTKASQTYSNTITLAVVLNQVQGNNWAMCRSIPAGKFVRLRSAVSGTASVSITSQQEVTR